MIDERVAMITPVAGTCTGPCGLASVRYTGQRADSETGLMYCRARYYDPAAGRYQFKYKNYPINQ